MKVVDVKFYKSVYKVSDLPKEQVPEIAFSGRSNVGKSSLLNTLVNRKGIAKTSSTPGRTQALNFIDVNSALYFVDLPGYGYARVPDSVKKDWQHLIEDYLEKSCNLKLVILIIDSRRDPREEEAQFVEWLKSNSIAYTVVLTKIDKLKKGKRQKAYSVWQKFLGIDQVLPFSALSGEGKGGIWSVIEKHLNAK
jgi:GTP-binding protein